MKKILPLFLIILGMIISSHITYAQEKHYGGFFECIVRDLGQILTSPFHLKGHDFLSWGSTAAITGFLIANDTTIYRSIKDFQDRNRWLDDISPQVTRLGSGEWNLGIAGAFYLGGLLFKDAKARKAARLTLMTFIHTGIVVQVGKHLSGRQRPSWDHGKDHWAGPGGFFNRYEQGQVSRYDAFPSGHTISIFGTAAVLAEMYKNTVWVPILSYTLATICGLSRVTEDTHWLSDVFLGAVMGIAIGRFVVKQNNRFSSQASPTNNPRLTYGPLVGGDRWGIRFTYIF